MLAPPASYSEFRRLAGSSYVVPVYTALVADLLRPVSAFLRLAPHTESRSKAGPYQFLLESVEGGEHLGRYTFFGVAPFQVISCRGHRITLARGSHRVEESGRIFDYLRQVGARYHPVQAPARSGEALPPFSAGAVGYLAYEAVRQLERLPPRVEPGVALDG